MEPTVSHRLGLDLFVQLNKEYANKRVVAEPRKFDHGSLHAQAQRRARSADKRLKLRGKRVLEVGTGRGHLGRVLADDYGCEYVGVDIATYPEWDEMSGRGVELVKQDVTASDFSNLGQFDAIISLAVLEHVVHPHAMLQAMYDLLRPGGSMYLAAQLYRGPKASHCYRQVYFPWPHLLFDEDVWRDFYRTYHNRNRTFAWCNKLTYAQYEVYFDKIGFERRNVWVTPSAFDADMYHRFEDQLSAYPIFDLSHDFVYAVLRRPVDTASGGRPKTAMELRQELYQMRSSTSWRITAPLRAAGQAARALRRR